MNDELSHPDVHQEEDTIPWGRVLLGLLVSFAIIAALIVAAWSCLKTSEARIRPSGVFPEERLGPRRSVTEVQADLFGEIGFGQRLNDKKRKELSRFAWVNREQKRVHVPIDLAMALVVEENRR
jgi:hypothetical protein